MIDPYLLPIGIGVVLLFVVYLLIKRRKENRNANCLINGLNRKSAVDNPVSIDYDISNLNILNPAKGSSVRFYRKQSRHYMD